MSGMVRFIPNQRTKSILVVSPQQTYLTRAERWIRSLDAKAQGTEKQLFTYSVRNRPAAELVEIIESMFSIFAPQLRRRAAATSPRVTSRQRCNRLRPKQAEVAHPPSGSPLGRRPAPALRSEVGTPAHNPTRRRRARHSARRGSGDEERVRVSVDELEQHTPHPCLAPGLSARAADHPKPRHRSEPGDDRSDRSLKSLSPTTSSSGCGGIWTARSRATVSPVVAPSARSSRGSPTPWPRLTRRSHSMLSIRSPKST